MPNTYSIELSKEQLDTLKSLCPKGSALQQALQIASITRPTPPAIKTFRAACSFADNYSVNRLKEVYQWVERLQSNAGRLLREWSGDDLLFSTILVNPAYPFTSTFDACEFARWYELAYDRVILLAFIKLLSEAERHQIEQQLHTIPDECDLRQSISFACDRLEEAGQCDVPNAWRTIAFKTTGDEEGWI